uniref:LOB domain-containing protein n=1 Tax=Quercus lobata TaxID=97700 RepID=A0A7N2M1S2_QUELO
MLEQLPLHLRAVAADCMSFEASSRVEDPVYGSVGIISQLQEQIIKAESELAKTKSEIAFHNAQQQPQQQQNESSSCKIEELHDTDEATTIPTVKPVSSKKRK